MIHHRSSRGPPSRLGQRDISATIIAGVSLNIKQAAPHEHTFVGGYTNGYIYYAPTTEQLRNPGSAQEDCDTLLAPEWQPIFEQKAVEILQRL